MMEEIREELREEIEDLAEYLEEEEEEDEEEREAREAREARMLRDNPWWEHPAAIDADPDIVKWEASRVRREPPLLGRMRLGTWPAGAAILVLGGPRGAGKTTLVKLQVRALLRGGTDPRNVFYCALDGGGGAGGLIPALAGYARLREGRHGGKGRRYAFLDEATSAPGWREDLEALAGGMLPRGFTVVAAGSGPAGASRAAGRLAGRAWRRDGASRYAVRPMGFAEFAALRDGEVGARVGELRGDAARGMLLAGGIPEGARGLRGAFGERLDSLLGEYLEAGGLPGIVDGWIAAGSVQAAARAGLLEGMAGDWGREGAAGLLARAGGALARLRGAAVSWKELRREAGLERWSDARDCAEFLEGASVALGVRRYGKGTGLPQQSSPVRFFFRDPAYAGAFGAGEVPPGAAVEGAVAECLARAAPGPRGCVTYWDGGGGGGADLVLRAGKGPGVPFRVAYGGGGGGVPDGFMGATGAERGAVISKNEMGQRAGCSVVPAAVFLALA